MDGTNLQGFTNQQAVEVLRHTGQTVQLTLARRGPKLESRIRSHEDVSGAMEKDFIFQTMDIGPGKGSWEKFDTHLLNFIFHFLACKT